MTAIVCSDLSFSRPDGARARAWPDRLGLAGLGLDDRVERLLAAFSGFVLADATGVR